VQALSVPTSGTRACRAYTSVRKMHMQKNSLLHFTSVFIVTVTVWNGQSSTDVYLKSAQLGGQEVIYQQVVTIKYGVHILTTLGGRHESAINLSVEGLKG
jgi:hypothetical protein